MIEVEKLRNLKGRRIYQFWLDEETGDITDVTSREDVIQVIYCKDCKYWDDHACFVNDKGFADDIILDRFENDYCSRAERKEE